MTVEVLEFPFRFDPANGRFSHVTAETDDEKSQQIRSFVLTKKGERPMMPSFGIEDPVFTSFDTGDFITSWSDFYSQDDINIKDISVSPLEDGTTDIIVEYE